MRPQKYIFCDYFKQNSQFLQQLHLLQKYLPLDSEYMYSLPVWLKNCQKLCHSPKFCSNICPTRRRLLSSARGASHLSVWEVAWKHFATFPSEHFPVKISQRNLSIVAVKVSQAADKRPFFCTTMKNKLRHKIGAVYSCAPYFTTIFWVDPA
jgi:hypothetical protein